MKKYGYSLLFTVVLAGLLLLCFSETEPSIQTEYPIAFSLETEDHSALISMYELEDGSYAVFLPSYADMASLEIIKSSESEIALGETVVTDGMCCGAFELETPYPLAVDGQSGKQLRFYRSGNVSTMYIDTITGTMDHVNKDKEHSEQISVMLINPEGILDALDSAAYIKGRGNSSWYYGKRPYLLTFSFDADLLGMGAAEKWVLLANTTDSTNLRNKLILELADQTGQVWTPDSAYVDLYLNGEYSGLYLLTEKVEAGTSRLDIDVQSGDFLGRIDLEGRWTRLKNPIKTQQGRTVEITSPGSLTKQTEAYIVDTINQMEQLILSGTDLSEAENFDLDSWVRKYLIDEISANIDADLASSYFYFSDGVCYSGPVWDYDMSFGTNGRNSNPTIFLAKIPYKDDRYSSMYYPALYDNESFYNRMVECYQTEFLPILNGWIDGGIYALAAEIQPASEMNYLRWKTVIDDLQSWKDAEAFTVDGLISYLEDRLAFLNSAWIDETEYCMLMLEYSDGASYVSIPVKKGEPLPEKNASLRKTVWIDESMGCTFDFDQPIQADVVLAKQQNQNTQTMDLDAVKSYVVILSLGCLAVFLFGMTMTDIHMRRKERTCVNERENTHVSP